MAVMTTRQIDLSAIGEQLKQQAYDDGYKAGYTAAMKNIAAYATSSTRKKHSSGSSDISNVIHIRKKKRLSLNSKWGIVSRGLLLNKTAFLP